MSYNYTGTKITGTSTSGTVFKKSGIKSAKKGQTYLNTSTGHVYKCTTKGKASKAKWAYSHTDIIAKPGLGVSGLGAPSRGSGHTMTASWSVPGNLTNGQSGSRATNLDVTWWLGIPGSDPSASQTLGAGATSSSVNLDGVTFGGAWRNRASFYPFTSNKLAYVTVRVQPRNGKGSGAAATTTRNFTTPRAPSISAISFNPDNGVVSATVTTDAGTDYAERYDTRYKVIVTDSRTGRTWNSSDSSSTSTSFTLSYNATDYQQLNYNQYIRVTFEAWARGYAGDSGHVSRTFYVSYPAQTTIQGVDVSAKDASGKLTVRLRTNSSAAHPVDRISLEYLANVTYKTASEIPGSASWTSADVTDDAASTALAMPVARLIPDRGKVTWIRVMAYHASEHNLVRYSDYRRVTAIETPAPTAADDEITILNVTAGTDGESAVVLLGWNADGQDDSTGTELTWSDYEDTWKSTKAPDSHEFTWSDGPVTYDEVTYQDSATITIKDLDEGAKYYIKARRYLEDDVKTYSPYSNTAIVVTSTTPETVVATCERYIPTGASLPVNWTFAGNGLQTAWQIVTTNGTIIANGEGSFGATRIGADRLEAFAENGTITFTVQASTGSGFVVSEEHTVTIIDNPTLEMSITDPLTVQPLSFNVTASTLCDLIVIVSAQGSASQYPTGLLRQTDGDTIHSGVYSPIWTANEGTGLFDATVTLPSGLDFWDQSGYEIAVTAIDRDTQLRSEVVTEPFKIAWAHQAPSIEPTISYTLTADTEAVEDKVYFVYDSATATYQDIVPEGDENPSELGWFEQNVTEYVTLTPIDEVDDEGMRHQAVQIQLTPPPNSAETDVYDIYRMTGDGAQLIGSGFPLTYTARDEYAPFGEDLTLYYRIAVRTLDGDVAFSDIEYVADADAMRFDWAGGWLELPYNISIADTYKKDVQTRQHMSGTVDGYWNSNITRTASLNSDLIRLTQQDSIDRARALARYPGAVFVRTPDGSAYVADVQVSDLSTEGQMTAIAIDATEIGLTSEYMLPTPFNLADE